MGINYMYKNMREKIITVIVTILLWNVTAAVLADPLVNYYIDYEGGNDNNSGIKDSPWKHHPWDPEAAGVAKAHTGISNYYFKKGVIYRGSLSVKESGTTDSPIVLGVDSDWGEGKAMVFGSERIIGGWKRCSEGDCPEILIEERDKVWYADTAFDYLYIPMMLYEIRDGQVIKLNIARSPNWTIPIPEKPQDDALDDPKTVWWEFTGYAFQSKLTLDSVAGFNVGDQVYKIEYSGSQRGVIKIFEIGADYINIAAEQTAKEDFSVGSQITNGSVTHTVNVVKRLLTRYKDNVNLVQSDPNFWKDGIVWYEDYCFWPRAARIQSYEPANNEIKFYCVRDQYINKKFYRYFIEGLPQLLDAENEWCYIRAKESPHRGRIYLRLEGDRDPNTTIIEKAKYHTFLNIEEKSNIIVEGLDIKFFNAREFYADPDDYPNYSYYPYYPKLANIDETRLRDGTRARAAEYFSPVIRITRNSSNISVVNCGIEYANVGIAIFPDGKNKLIENIKINHNRIAHMESNAVVTLLGENFGEIQWIWDWWPIKQGKPFSVLNSRIRYIQIKNNQIEDIGLRAQSWNPNGAIGLYDIENSEVADNTIDYTAVPGIDINSPGDYWREKGYTGGSDKMDFPLQRNLIHHNQVSRGCLMTEDMGGMELWHAGTNYIYSNISGNHVGSRYPYKRQNPTSKDYYRIGAFAPGLYIDNGFKNYVFNNIFWGKNNNENDFIYNSVGYNDYNAIQNTVFNNTIYNCAVGIHKGGEHDNRNYYLNNLIINTYERYIRDTVTARSQLDSVGYACNLFNGQIRPLFGQLQLVSLPTKAEFVNFLSQKKSICLDPGEEVFTQQVIDAPSLDFHLLDNSSAIDKAKKVFVPWGLYAVAGEWNFYKYPADINRLLDEHFYWNKEWLSLPVVQTSPPQRYDLFSYNTNESDFKMGILEDWVESSLELNGQTQFLSRNADECGLLDMDKDADGNEQINNFLIEVLLKVNSGENHGGIVEKADGTKGYTLALVNGYLKMAVKFGEGECSRMSAVRINNGGWHHIIAEVDRNAPQGINIYTDGKLANGGFQGSMNNSVSISNNGDFIVARSEAEGHLAATFDFLRVSRGTLADAQTTIEELYEWEFNGPFLRDFYGNPMSGVSRDVGAIEYISQSLTGDIDADDDVDILDLQLCVNVVLGGETEPMRIKRAKAVTVPVDYCNVLDVQAIVNLLLKL